MTAAELDRIALRFWVKVKIPFLPNALPDYSKCWEWQGTRGSGKRGLYGRFRMQGERFTAHRIAFMLHYKRVIPKELDGAHLCDNPPCCNPTHIRPARHRANVQEWWFKYRNKPAPKCVVYLPLTAAEKLELVA